jgi:hypothetical protein
MCQICHHYSSLGSQLPWLDLLRIEYPGARYPITARGNARQTIYLDHEV